MSLIPAFKLGLYNAWTLVLVGILFHIIPTLLIMAFSRKLRKRFSERPEDIYHSNREKVIGQLTMIITYLLIGYSIFLPLRLGTEWFRSGLTIFTLGVMIYLLTSISWITTPVEKPVTSGTYRFSRHPIYLSLFIQFFGIGTASASWVFMLLSIGLIFCMNLSVISEERGCCLKYGDAYEKYLEDTPRFIGLPRRKRKVKAENSE
jgi:protein-S-isoprenylcysteine O-methyltransferase Ste14